MRDCRCRPAEGNSDADRGPAVEGLLFADRIHTVKTEEARADEVLSYFRRKVSKEAARNLLYCLAGPFERWKPSCWPTIEWA